MSGPETSASKERARVVFEAEVIRHPCCKDVSSPLIWEQPSPNLV